MNNFRAGWLSLEPFVHGVVKNNQVLLYNTVNKKHLIYNGLTEISEIVQQLLDPGNGYVYQLTKDQVKSSVIHKFIAQLRKKYMGDVFAPGWSASKPFNILPEPVIKKGLQTLEHHLHEITFHLDSGSDKNLERYKDASKQFIYPIYTSQPTGELSADIIHSVFNQISTLPLATINFVSSGIMTASGLEKLSSMFAGTSFRRKFHMPLIQSEQDCWNGLKKFDWLSLYVTFPLDRLQTEKLAALCQHNDQNQHVEFYFIVQKSEDVDQAIEIIGQFSIKQAFFKPYFNGENMQFFKDHVFITEEDVKLSQPSQNQIFSRLTMNENDYGKLIILPDGSVLANLNDEVVGNAITETLESIIRQEINSGKSWNRMRKGVNPCSDCIFQFLCPPISNYEIYLNRFNFCHIHS